LFAIVKCWTIVSEVLFVELLFPHELKHTNIQTNETNNLLLKMRLLIHITFSSFKATNMQF